ncbi:MAG: tetratricopeptide repeat protein [Alphaproteobacteria bacterium]|nr:tetratricopeptide repeat protein [Alphaproteobacteria bacterium]
MQRNRASNEPRPVMSMGRRLSSLARTSLLAAAAVCTMTSIMPARADVAECERSYQLGRKDEAIRLCRRAAWQENDFFAQVKLGDIYSAKRDDDKGYYDPVEAFVWYFLAGRNSAIFDHMHLDPAADAVVSRLVGADTDSRGIYRNLLQDERIDARNRVTYIEACRGGEGFILLGQLHDPFIAQRHQGSQGAPLTGVTDQPYWRRPVGRGSGLLPPRSTPAPSPYPSSSGSGGYPGSSSSGSRFGADFWGNKLCNNSEWLGWMTPSSSCSRYSTGDGTSSVFPTSVIESMVFYQLADRAGHPIAKIYIDALKNWPSDYSNGSDTKNGQSPDVLAKAKAQRWLAPFEFYAAETRYRGETPSGLVHSDECTINARRAQALAMGERLIPQHIRKDLLQFLGFFRGDNAMPRAVAKYQDFLGDPQTGQFTPVQLTRLVQIGAVRGNARAQRVLGIMYVKGIGVVTDYVRAEKWLLAAAEQGDGEAMYALSELYTQGADGVEKSEDRANRFRQGSASAGFQPVKSEFLRILEAAPSAQPKGSDECKTRRCRRERERAAQQQDRDETDDSGIPPS